MDMDTKNDGTWTMVYDEGFQVMIGGQVFFAFSKYTASEVIFSNLGNHCER